MSLMSSIPLYAIYEARDQESVGRLPWLPDRHMAPAFTTATGSGKRRPTISLPGPNRGTPRHRGQDAPRAWPHCDMGIPILHSGNLGSLKPIADVETPYRSLQSEMTTRSEGLLRLAPALLSSAQITRLYRLYLIFRIWGHLVAVARHVTAYAPVSWPAPAGLFWPTRIARSDDRPWPVRSSSRLPALGRESTSFGEQFES